MSVPRLLFSHHLRACGIRHAFTTRIGGYSRGPYASLNLGRSVEDDPRAVARNRALVLTTLGLEGAHEVEAAQVHGPWWPWLDVRRRAGSSTARMGW